MLARSKAVILVLMVLLVGCATNIHTPQVSVIRESQSPRIGEARSKTDTSGVSKDQNTPEEIFVRSIAGTHPIVSVDAMIGLNQVRGYYLGQRHGCDRISLFTAPRRLAHYEVCGDRIREIAEVAPAMPRSSDLTQLRDSVARRAWETKGQVISTFEGYDLSAIPVGFSDSQGCIVVEEYVAYESLLVDRRQSRVCP